MLPARVALPAAIGILVLGLIVTLATGGRAEKLQTAMSQTLAGEGAALGLKVAAIHVQGASPAAERSIRAALGVQPGDPIMGASLSDLRARVLQVGWVKDAQVVRLLPDTLVIAVQQRDTLAVWQRNRRMVVIDGSGAVIPEADPGRFPELPLIVGAGANDSTALRILPAIAQRPGLRDRLEALVRVDERRWDLRLKDGSLIQLPAVDEESALIQLDQLEERQQILTLGFSRIDLREPGMVAVRPRETQTAAVTAPLVADGV
ncbi:cell division protein FtsQ [Caulobacter ginsengisoli]|uniref:Cell division protein FtsQ n=1 Tax=Caulobacter ginsengisoli TaxID=400775 RepID=A0ABU0IMU2_9CAUL|nr:cell division protein FtsQ/DivIB [Caulobacter ginsengisoli]MDQ0462272.1 cell division protein FtsQ [Caulobacter ginsengisoli]